VKINKHICFLSFRIKFLVGERTRTLLVIVNQYSFCVFIWEKGDACIMVNLDSVFIKPFTDFFFFLSLLPPPPPNIAQCWLIKMVALKLPKSR